MLKLSLISLHGNECSTPSPCVNDEMLTIELIRSSSELDNSTLSSGAKEANKS